MKIKILVLGLAVCSAGLLHSQTGSSNPEAVTNIQKRTLIIVTEEENPKLTASLGGDELAQYKKDVEDYNRDIKDAVTGFWKFNSTIEYKTRAEMNKLVTAKCKDYAYIEYNKFTVNCANSQAYKLTCQFREGAKEITLAGSDYISTQLNIRLCDENPFGPPVFGVKLASPFPNKADLVYALNAIQLQFRYKLEGKSNIAILTLFKANAKALANLTLLVNEKNTDLNIDEIKKAYPYPVELVKKEKIDAALLSPDEKTAFVIVIPTSGSSFSFYALSAKDCSVLGYTYNTQSTGVKVGLGGRVGMAMDMDNDMTKMKVKKDHFKLFAERVK
ncbi:MAG: hypothetical protein ACHQK8_03350 [Bacteroidia bacterium]